jgi:hypothetical protein
MRPSTRRSSYRRDRRLLQPVRPTAASVVDHPGAFVVRVVVPPKGGGAGCASGCEMPHQKSTLASQFQILCFASPRPFLRGAAGFQKPFLHSATFFLKKKNQKSLLFWRTYAQNTQRSEAPGSMAAIASASYTSAAAAGYRLDRRRAIQTASRRTTKKMTGKAAAGDNSNNNDEAQTSSGAATTATTSPAYKTPTAPPPSPNTPLQAAAIGGPLPPAAAAATRKALQRARVTSAPGFIAALDQSGGKKGFLALFGNFSHVILQSKHQVMTAVVMVSPCVNCINQADTPRE